MKRTFVIFVAFCQFFAASRSGSSEFDNKPSRSKVKLAESLSLKNVKPKLRSEADIPETATDFGIVLDEEHANDTITIDHHIYYNSTFYTDPEKAKEFWIDLDKLPQDVVVNHKMLSDSYRQASTVDLSFDFPFYGSVLRNMTIATGGFLYVGDYLHNWIAATQYIAPLMANFDTTVSDNSTIKYADNGTAFTVQWDHVFIQDKIDDGAFAFQATLFNTGDISFAYKEIPFSISKISDAKHPVKVGISDAYILERAVFFVRRKTIYEYHRIDMLKKEIASNTALYFTALTTCLGFKDCQSCSGAPQALECVWCEAVQRCSDGVDRQRQSWVMNGCTIQHEKVCPTTFEINPEVATASQPIYEKATKTSSAASVAYTTSKIYTTQKVYTPNSIPDDFGSKGNSNQKEDLEIADHFVQDKVERRHENAISTGAVVTIVIFAAILVGIGMWIFYAYRFPQSSSGQFLIKYRPSQWTRKPEGHSTNSDSFHM